MGNNQQAFFELIRAGLWEKEVRLLQFGKLDFKEIYRLAREQSVVGLIAAGLEHVVDIKVPKEIVLQFVGQALQLEQRNSAMNSFISSLIEKMRAADIYTLLVKGQGIAQCYERPLWRACGDVDLFLNDENYEKMKSFLLPMASFVENERVFTKHLGMIIDSWEVELHGTLRCGLSRRINRGLDDIKDDIFIGGNVRSWKNGDTQVSLPSPDNDVIIVFTHILEHFYKGGIGLRQICDLCRVLWTYKSSLNVTLLEKRLKQMGLKVQWKGFGAFAVVSLGMPPEAMPLYSSDKKWSRKAKRICAFVLEVGNFGHNRDNSYYATYPFLKRKIHSFGRRCGDIFRHAMIFPWDSIRFFPGIFLSGLKAVVNGK